MACSVRVAAVIAITFSVLALYQSDVQLEGLSSIMTVSGTSRAVAHRSSEKHEQSVSSSVCQSILDGFSREEFTGKPITIREDPAVCRSESDITASLMEIFVSSFLAQQGQNLGIPIQYDHGCQLQNDGRGLVQGFLPSPIIMPQNIPTRDKHEVHEICSKLVQQPSQFILENVPLRNHILPLIHLNLRAIVEKAISDRALLQFPQGIFSMFDMPGPFDEPNSEAVRVLEDVAVIYLPCMDEACSDLWLLPAHVYLENLPSSIRSIDIVLDQNCVNHLQHCNYYGQELANTMQSFFVRASVSLVISNPSTIDVTTRLMQAEYVVCGPGHGMVCLLPALARFSVDNGSSSRFPIGRITILNAPTPTSGSKMITSQLSSEMFHPTIRQHLIMPDEELLGSSLAQFKDATDMIAQFVRSLQKSKSEACRILRGRAGTWVQDMHYAKTAQYSGPLHHQVGKAERMFREKVERGEFGDLQYRPSTTYKWAEATYPTCDMSLTSREGMCDVLRSLNVGRIFILGDSLNEEIGLSFWMTFMTGEDDPKSRISSGFRYVIPCGNDFEFTLQFKRNDELLENDQPVDTDQQMKNCHNYCYPWTAEYTDDPRRTILLANTGAHLKEPSNFRASVDNFIHTFDSLDRPDDVVLFRTNVPGHKNCGRPGLKPFNAFEEYLNDLSEEKVKHTYNWNMFTLYNDYIARVVERRKLNAGGQERQAKMEVLDVFPMTVLRVDGHAADEFIAQGTKISDCLHYSMPGPIDWWGHLTFSHLLDLAKSESKQ